MPTRGRKVSARVDRENSSVTLLYQAPALPGMHRPQSKGGGHLAVIVAL